MKGDPVEKARAEYEAGNLGRSREVALQGLADRPDDADLLRLAGRSSAELGLGDAAGYLRRAVDLQPGDAQAWRDLGDALLAEGRLPEATDAFRQALELRPDDVGSLVDLAHSAYAAGKTEEAIAHLTDAVGRNPENVGALRGLVEMYRGAGRTEDALAAARQITERRPDDVLATLDVAELSLGLAQIDEAVSAYGRLREIDDDPEHEVYAYHGMIQAEIQRGEWRRALDLAIEATRVDRYGRTTDLLAFVVAQVFGTGDRPAPTRADVDAALEASRAEHRRLHLDALVL